MTCVGAFAVTVKFKAGWCCLLVNLLQKFALNKKPIYGDSETVLSC